MEPVSRLQKRVASVLVTVSEGRFILMIAMQLIKYTVQLIHLKYAMYLFLTPWIENER